MRTTFFPFIEGDVLAVNLAMQAGTKAEITKAQIDRMKRLFGKLMMSSIRIGMIVCRPSLLSIRV